MLHDANVKRILIVVPKRARPLAPMASYQDRAMRCQIYAEGPLCGVEGTLTWTLLDDVYLVALVTLLATG